MKLLSIKYTNTEQGGFEEINFLDLLVGVSGVGKLKYFVQYTLKHIADGISANGVKWN
jgi:hypothetical protein